MFNPFIILYIDPGTGSMLFTILIGVVTAIVFLLKDFFLKLKFRLQGGRTADLAETKIPIVIFSEGTKYQNVFIPLCNELEKRMVSSEYWTMDPDDPVLNLRYKYISPVFIGEGNTAFARLNMMNAAICVSTTPGLDVYQWKRSKKTDKYVHIFHSMDDGTLYKMFALDYYDAVLAPNRLVETKMRRLEEMRNLNQKEFRLVGLTYMDLLRERLESASAVKKDTNKLTVLVAPSWGINSIFNRYGSDFLKALIDTEFNIIVRPHPQSIKSEKAMLESLTECFLDGKTFRWDFSDDNFNSLNESDIMISDFSSVIFDYSFVFDKPVLYADTSFDASQYDASWLSEPIWTLDVLSLIGRRIEKSDFPNLKQIIDDMMTNPSYKDTRNRVRDEFYCCRGEAAKNIVDFLLDEQKQG